MQTPARSPQLIDREELTVGLILRMPRHEVLAPSATGAIESGAYSSSQYTCPSKTFEKHDELDKKTIRKIV